MTGNKVGLEVWSQFLSQGSEDDRRMIRKPSEGYKYPGNQSDEKVKRLEIRQSTWTRLVPCFEGSGCQTEIQLNPRYDHEDQRGDAERTRLRPIVALQ